nr:hypothetical protein [uncultured Ruminococcus sp.]
MRSHTRRKRRQKRKRKRRRTLFILRAKQKHSTAACDRIQEEKEEEKEDEDENKEENEHSIVSARLPSESRRRLKRKADHHQTVCLAIVCFMKMNVPLRALHFTEVWKNHQTDPKAQCLCGV